MNKKLAQKLAIVFAIGLVMLIVLANISGTIDERQSFQYQAQQSIAQSWTGSQMVQGPILVLPFTRKWTQKIYIKDKDITRTKEHTETGVRYVLPKELDLNVVLNTEKRYKGIYSVPVYVSEIAANGYFDQNDIQKQVADANGGGEYRVTWHKAKVGLSVSDARGINNLPILKIDNKVFSLESGSHLPLSKSGLHAELNIGNLNKKVETLSFDLNYSLRGLEGFSILPSAKNVQAKITSPWPHPKFTGGFLPVTRDITQSGFSASWSVNSFASNVEENFNSCIRTECQDYRTKHFGLELIEPVDIYLQSERSIKYGVLFIALVFVAFFLFEITKKLAIHPIQYTLVGFSIAIFYLLLISISEHLAFAKAYLIAAIACTLLLSTYIKTIMKNWIAALGFGLGLAVLYGVLFVIISAEDAAMLMGAGLVFTVLAALMYLTRNVDWYEVSDRIDMKPNLAGYGQTKQSDNSNNREKGEGWLD